MKIKKIGHRWFALKTNGFNANKWIPFIEKQFEFIDEKYQKGEHEVDLEVEFYNHGPKCSGLWPDLNHYECAGTGLIAKIENI